MNVYHRYFTQYMLKNGVVTVDNALAFCKHVSQGKIENMTQFKTMVIELNREISKQFYKIGYNTCEVTDRDVIVWLNTRNDDIAKHQISYSSLELEYFHAILQEILNTEDHRITFIVCINITSTLTAHFSRDNGQITLNEWIRGGYYIRNGDFIYLGPRLILEFTSYLRSHCPNSICSLCSELVFTGERCGHCNKILHSYCLSRYLINQDGCPCCKSTWIELGNRDGYDITVEETDESSEDSRSIDLDGNDTVTSTADNLNGLTTLTRSSSRRGNRSKYSQHTQQDDDSGPSRRKRQK